MMEYVIHMSVGIAVLVLKGIQENTVRSTLMNVKATTVETMLSVSMGSTLILVFASPVTMDPTVITTLCVIPVLV